MGGPIEKFSGLAIRYDPDVGPGRIERPEAVSLDTPAERPTRDEGRCFKRRLEMRAEVRRRLKITAVGLTTRDFVAGSNQRYQRSAAASSLALASTQFWLPSAISSHFQNGALVFSQSIRNSQLSNAAWR